MKIHASKKCILYQWRVPATIVARLCLLLLIATATNGSAANYFVKPDGSNNRNGRSVENAWRTLRHAADRVQSGDSVFVLPGSYNERVTINASGNNSAKIVFLSIQRHQAAVDGGFRISGRYVRLEGFQIFNTMSGWPDENAVFIENDNVEIVGNKFTEIRKAAIRGNWDDMPRDVLISENYIYRSQIGIIAEGRDWLVENNEIERMVKHSSGDSDYCNFFGEGHVFRNNRFHGTRRNEIGAAHVDGFQTYDNNNKYARNIYIYNNFVSDFMQGLMAEAHYHSNSENIFVTNNIFSKGFSDNSHGIIIQDIPNVTISNNVFYDIRWQGVSIQPNDNQRARNALIKNNVFSRCNTSYSFFGSSSFGDYNILYQTPNHDDGGPNDRVVDPRFEDAANGNFQPRSGSPLIDGGDPASSFRDPEDPSRPGFAIHPAHGTLRNDVGAYGGPQVMNWVVTGLPDVPAPLVAATLLLDQNYPNPFNPSTVIGYSLSVVGSVKLEIFDILGRKVRTLVNENQPSGSYSVSWNGRDDAGSEVVSGVYFYRLISGGQQLSRQMILLR